MGNRGGLGHFALLWAVALGAEVTVISHTADKKDDAMQMGAKDFVNSTQKDWAKPLAFKFDFALNTADDLSKFDLTEYFSILKVMGHFHNVGYVLLALVTLQHQDTNLSQYARQLD